MAPNWRSGDVVVHSLYGESILYRLVCFFDRGNELACLKHQDIEPKTEVDDCHLVVIWKKHKAIAPSWPVGESVTANVVNLRAPDNELLTLALEAA